MSNRLLQRKVSDSQLETVILSIDNLPLISTVTENSTAPITSGAVFSALALKQNTLVSGTNIKTIDGVSVLGSGNIPAYVLPTASKTTLGGVKVGDNLTITTAGVLNATDTTYKFTGGTNSFVVTPSNGTAQTVTVTPQVNLSDVTGILPVSKGGTGNSSIDDFPLLNSTKMVPSKGISKYIASRGQNLLTNGTALLGTNFNFSALIYDGSDTYYAGGCFKSTRSQDFKNDEYIPVDINQQYKFAYYIKSSSSAATYYDMIRMFDIDYNEILAETVMFMSGTLTTLAADLNDGDTTITLTDASGWNNTTTAKHQLGVIFWNYSNSYGYTYPAETYSRNRYLNIFATGAISGNVITLKSAWTYGTVAAGTQLSQSNSGGTYQYLNGNYTLNTDTWTLKTGILSGVAPNNAGGKFRYGTAFVKIGYLINYNKIVNTTTKLSTLSFGLDNASKSDLDAKADDSSVVHKAGIETINGTKTFSSADGIIINSSTLKETSKTIQSTATDVLDVSKKTFFENGAVFNGTAASAGLVTRGISGCDVDGNVLTSLFLNYRGSDVYDGHTFVYLGGTSSGYIAARRGDFLFGAPTANYVPVTFINGNNVSTTKNLSIDGHTHSFTDLLDKPTIDSALSTTSTNAVQNKIINAAINTKQNILTFDTTPTANSTNPVISGGIKTYVDSAVSSVYKYKGSIATYADLPTTDLTAGDVYNVEDTGDNYAWTSTVWDKLAGTVDLSAYLTTATAENTYAKLSSVNSALAGKQETLVSGTNIKTIGGVSVLGSGNIPMPTSGYKQTFNVNGSEWGVCYKGLNEMLKEDDIGKPADTYVAPTLTIFKSWQLNGVDVAYPKQITGANSYNAKLESLSSASDIANLSWDAIIVLAKNNAFDSTHLGQTKQLDIGGVAYTVQIVGVNHDDLTDGTGKANLTFELKYLLATNYKMNDTDTNSGGWEASAMRTNVLPNILSQMPTNIQNAIKSVNKANCKVYNSATITYTSDKLFLLSEAEVFGVKKWATALEGTQYEYWANNNTDTARIKYKGEGRTTAGIWWLRSPAGEHDYFCYVYSDGHIYSISANYPGFGVSFAFDL